MGQIGVFISYNHQDKIIADAIVEALTSISSDLSVFIDHSGLEGGRRLREQAFKVDSTFAVVYYDLQRSFAAEQRYGLVPL